MSDPIEQIEFMHELASVIMQGGTVAQFDAIRKKHPQCTTKYGDHAITNLLCDAVTYGNVPLLQHIIEINGKEDINLTDHVGFTPLFFIVHSPRKYECAKMLLENGANPNIASKQFIHEYGFKVGKNITMLHETIIMHRLDNRLTKLIMLYGAYDHKLEANPTYISIMAEVIQERQSAFNICCSANQSLCKYLPKDVQEIIFKMIGDINYVVV